MTAEQIYQKWTNEYHLEGNNGGIQKHKFYILQMMQEYAKLMCDDQKKICLDNVRISTGFDWTTETLNPYVIRESVMQSPYPEELL